jgi:uncharacterized protein (TIGR03437 family)
VLVTPANPAKRGEVLSLFLTGRGPLTLPVPTGVLGPVLPPVMTTQPVVIVNSTVCAVSFAGYAPGNMGLYQVNFEVAQQVQSGPSQSLQVYALSGSSQLSAIAIQ